MPTYCFRRKDGRVVDRSFPMGHAPKVVRCADGNLARRDMRAEHMPRDADKGQHNPRWPMKSQGMGINRDQIPEAMKHPKAKEHRHQYDSETGAMVFDSRGHRKLCMQDIGYHDIDGGYGDP